MASARSVARLVQEALQILHSLGVPTAGLTERRKEKMAKAFMALADIRPGMLWSGAKSSEEGRALQSRQVIAYMNTHLAEDIADSSYDNIRRKDLILPVEALVVLKSAKNPDANTKDGTRGFALSPQAASAIRLFGRAGWKEAAAAFLHGRESLASQLERKRGLARIEVQINADISKTFSAGKHNLLQKQIIEDFLPIFGFGANVLYVGDSANKSLFMDSAGLAKLKFFELAHDKLPDVVAYSSSRNWLYLIEAVTTANPITELRRKTLLELTPDGPAAVILVSAFPDRETYRKFAKDIAWETEVWIADAPEHMIHFNGEKFLGPYQSS